MAETTADVRRDIELTRERMSDTILELEQKLDVGRVVRDHPWPAIGLAAAAGFLLSGTGADAKAAGAAATTVAATKGKASRVGPLLDDLVAKVLVGINDALQQRADELVEELKLAIGAPTGGRTQHRHPEGQGAYGDAHARAHAEGIPHDHVHPGEHEHQHHHDEGFAGMPPRAAEMEGTEAWSTGDEVAQGRGARRAD